MQYIEVLCIIALCIARDGTFGGPEIVTFLERRPDSSKRCEYRVLGTNRTGTMEKELVAIEEEGFTLIDLAQANELTAVLERLQ